MHDGQAIFELSQDDDAGRLLQGFMGLQDAPQLILRHW